MVKTLSDLGIRNYMKMIKRTYKDLQVISYLVTISSMYSP